jgi:hypothetical protein
MGGGLSKLQRYILSEAEKRHRVYYAEILNGYFGWTPHHEFQYWGMGAYENDHRGEPGTLVNPGGHHFRRREIGATRYNRTMATLSRACHRLVRRGLVTLHHGPAWSGVEITDEGKRWRSANSVG